MNSSWQLYAIVALPGVINLIAAWQELDKRCRSLIFFKPLLSPGFYIWGIFQLIAPSLLFWYALDIPNHKQTLGILFLEALSSGVGFVAVLNATTEVGTIPIKLKPIYSFFIEIAYDVIAQKQTRHTAYFWRQVEVELEQCPEEKLGMGLNYLEEYFIVDIALDEAETKAYQSKLHKIRGQPLTGQIKPIKTLLKEVRRADLAIALREFSFATGRVKELLKLQ